MKWIRYIEEGDWIAQSPEDHCLAVIRHRSVYDTETIFHIEYDVHVGSQTLGPFLSLSSAKRQGMKKLRELIKENKP